MSEVTGNLKGLSTSEKRSLEKLFNRKVQRDEVISYDFAREIFVMATSLSRRIGILLTREGRVLEVVVGTKQIVYLPDLGRYRFGKERLRQLRLIFTDLSNNPDEVEIPSDIYADLEKLRLDAVVGVKEFKNRLAIAYAHVLPNIKGSSESSIHTEQVPDLGRFEVDFYDYIESLERELSAEQTAKGAGGQNGALLIGVYPKRYTHAESSMLELKELARTAGVKVLDSIVQFREIDPKTLLGKGKLEEVVLRCLRLGAEMLIFDTELKPAQWRIITNSTDLKVIDRSMLILDIFAQRATSSDGRLQVELAQLKYNLPRLVEKDAGLSRLSGGIGGRGPGETKLEIGRRRIRDRIADLDKRITKLSETRGLKRQKRQENSIPLVAILGYTNVGKSTLFNALTKSTVIAENKLFATLDPAQRRLNLPMIEGEIQPKMLVLSDTVGFIRELPDELMNAFRATLEELSQANLLIHVLDASDPEIESRKATVEEILKEMKLEGIPTIQVLNKIDKLPKAELDELVFKFDAIPVSAINRENFSELLTRIHTMVV